MAQILKIKYEGTTRRMPVSIPGGFCYSELEKNVRDFFEVPCTSRVIITYVDTEGDVVTMGNDQDLGDACVRQQLNPLKLQVKVVSTQPLQARSEATIKESATRAFHRMEFDVGGLLKGLFPESTANAIEQVLSRYPPSLFTTVPAHALPDALDTFLKTLTGYRENSDTPAVAPLAEGGHLEAVPKEAVHKSISCDYCDMFPIVGPRYKSTKKDDYDICSKCFVEIGNATDYIKLDRPKESEIHSRIPSLSVNPVKFSDSWNLKVPPIVEKNGVLDAQFVADVTILDETKMEIGTSFTKVWRLKNSGTLPWPRHIQLVYIGGNLFGSSGIVKLRLPNGGLPCGIELDVSVDLKAPKRSGHYDGHWCLMAPSGKMFGEEVWVSIEAVPNTHAREVKESLIKHASDSPVRRLLDRTRFTLEDEYCLKKLLVNSPSRFTDETDYFPLAANEIVKERVKDETFTRAKGFELVVSELASEESGFEQDDANTEPLQSSCFEEDDSLTSGGWDYMLEELEEMGLDNTQTNEDLVD